MIVVDASVLIALLDDLDAHHVPARDVLARRESFGIHTINLAETLIHGVRTDQLSAIASVIERAGVRELARQAGEAQALAVLRVSTGLKIPDCCVLAAADQHGARLATFDDRLARVARDRGNEVLGAGR